MEENKTLETAVEQPQFKTVKKVRIKDFDMENVEIVPYNEDIIGDNDELTYENYINLHGQVYPDILDSMKDGTHKMDEAESYIADYVKDKFKDKNRSVAAVSSNTKPAPVFCACCRNFIFPGANLIFDIFRWYNIYWNFVRCF